MDIFETQNYRIFLREAVQAAPRKGYGLAKRIASHLGVSTTLISQVLSERRHITLDQAFLWAEFINLNDLQTRYFLTLVQFEKASHLVYKKYLTEELLRIRQSSKKIENRLTHQSILSEEQKAMFYSDWTYSAIRLLTSVPGFSSPELIAERLALPVETVRSTLKFLQATGLVVSDVKGGLHIGPLSTHVSSQSPWVKLHHRNWRDRAARQPGSLDGLHYTSPMTLSALDAKKIRSLLLQTIEDIGKTVDDSPEEELMCLNIDWFAV